MTHVPAHYSLPEHLARIIASDAFRLAALEVGKTLDEFSAEVNRMLKEVIAEHRREELQNYEELLGAAALYRAMEKYKDFVAEALKELQSKYVADEVAAHEAKVATVAIAKAKKRSAA